MMSRRFWVALVLTLPVFAIAMLDMLPGSPLSGLWSERAWVILQVLLTTPVVLWAAAPFFARGWQSLVRRRLFYNALGVPIAAGALYPVFGLLLNPMWAAAAMSLSSVSVILNALRLRKTAL